MVPPHRNLSLPASSTVSLLWWPGCRCGGSGRGTYDDAVASTRSVRPVGRHDDQAAAEVRKRIATSRQVPAVVTGGRTSVRS